MIRPGIAGGGRILIALAALLLVSGCEDRGLWARYSAERDNWHARKLVDRIRVNPRIASERDYARARAAYESITRRYPPSQWAGARGETARDVARLAAAAGIAAGQLDEMRGDASAALARYARLESEWSAAPEVALEAAVARARALERADRDLEAVAEWRAIAMRYPLVDETGGLLDEVLDAPAHAADLLRRSGRAASADTVLAEAEVRVTAELERRKGSAIAPELWARLADLCEARGDWGGALRALRAALFEPAARRERPGLVLSLARVALNGGHPDTARVYAAWADTAFGRSARAEARLTMAAAWEASGPPDSALAAYRRYLDDNSQQPDGSAHARFQCGMILEQTGRWEEAHSEYRALEAAQPTHPLAFASLLRIVNHHLGQGESDLAHLEARQAIERLDQILATQRDETTAMRARIARAQLLVTLDRSAEACDELTQVWQRYGRAREAAQAGLEAARLAERALHDPARARALYEDIAARSIDGETRDAARAEAARLGTPG